MKFKEVQGTCSKLNKECDFIAEYKEIMQFGNLKLVDMLNVDTNKHCHKPTTCWEFNNCEAYKNARDKA